LNHEGGLKAFDKIRDVEMLATNCLERVGPSRRRIGERRSEITDGEVFRGGDIRRGLIGRYDSKAWGPDIGEQFESQGGLEMERDMAGCEDESCGLEEQEELVELDGGLGWRSKMLGQAAPDEQTGISNEHQEPRLPRKLHAIRDRRLPFQWSLDSLPTRLRPPPSLLRFLPRLVRPFVLLRIRLDRIGWRRARGMMEI
jgi:hypothetical protein